MTQKDISEVTDSDAPEWAPCLAIFSSRLPSELQELKHLHF